MGPATATIRRVVGGAAANPPRPHACCSLLGQPQLTYPPAPTPPTGSQVTLTRLGGLATGQQVHTQAVTVTRSESPSGLSSPSAHTTRGHLGDARRERSRHFHGRPQVNRVRVGRGAAHNRWAQQLGQARPATMWASGGRWRAGCWPPRPAARRTTRGQRC